jgi:hypothetical protein
MTKTRAFVLMSAALAWASASALAGPWPDSRWRFEHHDRHYEPWFARPYVLAPVPVPVIVQQPVIVAQPVTPVVVQSVTAPAASTVITVPPGSEVTIRQGWNSNATVVTSGYRAAWAESAPALVPAPVLVASDGPIVTSSPVIPVPVGVVTSPDVIVVPNTPIIVSNTVVEPLGAADRLVVLNEFSDPYATGRTLVYRDASGLLHERPIFSTGGIFYDHLGRRCRYDQARSMVVVLDDRVVRDYNHNGLADDARFIDLHRRAELRFHDSTIYHPIGGVTHGPALDGRSRFLESGLRNGFDRSPSFSDGHASGLQSPAPVRPMGPAVNGRLIDQSRLTGGDSKSTRSTTSPRR